MTYDLLIVGGGINGCAIAREAALHGLKVLLVEKDDLAGHTSSASTKLIHGGLRYLEYYEFKLVREALEERERLLFAAPHLIQPLAFVLPDDHSVRPWWMVRIGLWLYDLLAGRSSLPRSRSLRKDDQIYRQPMQRADDMRGFVYYDARVDDARLTLANAIDARENGAEIRTRTALTKAAPDGDGWKAVLSDGETVCARMIVNAAGPWVSELLQTLGVAAKSRVRLVKGSHIVVHRVYNGPHAYILQQPDRRIVFAINWEGEYTMIGTTDIPVDKPEDAVIDEDEVTYLREAVNRYLKHPIEREHVTAHWSGVRPLYDDGASDAKSVTREYVLEVDDSTAPVLSVFGGKITTGRALAEDAMRKIAPLLGIDAHPVTRARIFPGGAIDDFDHFLEQVRARWPFLGDARSLRMGHAYGTHIVDMLDAVTSEGEMGQDFGAGLTEIEVRWMRDQEWATSVEDVLWRRSKLGMHIGEQGKAALEAWWGKNGAD